MSFEVLTKIRKFLTISFDFLMFNTKSKDIFQHPRDPVKENILDQLTDSHKFHPILTFII